MLKRNSYLSIPLLILILCGCQKRIPLVAPPQVTPRERKIAAEKTALAQEANHHYNLGIIWKQNDTDEAIKEFNQAIKINPNMASAYFELGEIYAGLKQLDAATNNYQRAFELDNQLFEALLRIAELHKEKKEYRAALKLSEQVLAKNPREKKALALKQEIVDRQEMPPRLIDKGWKLIGENKFQAALETFETIFKYDNQYLDAYWSIGETYRYLKDFPQSEKYFNQAIIINPNYSRAYSGLGWLEMNRDNEERAAKYFREALVKDDNNTEAFEGLKQALAAMTEKVPERYFLQGLKLFEQGNYSDAKVQFERSLSFNEKYYKSIYGLGDILQKQGELAGAEEKYLSALKVAPQDIPVLMRLANLYNLMGNYEQAIAKLDEVLDIKPDLTEALESKAEVEKKIDKAENFYRIGENLLKYDSSVEAREEFNKALRLNSQFKKAWVGIAEAYILEKDYVTAKFYFQKALEIDPLYFPALIGMSKSEYRLKDFKQAYYYLNQAEKASPLSQINKSMRDLLATVDDENAHSEYRKIPDKTTINRADWASLLILELNIKDRIQPVKEAPVITDIDQSWARDFIMDVVVRDLMTVYQNHTFGPDKIIIRQDLAQYIQNLAIHLAPEYFSANKFSGMNSPFTDVSNKHVYFNAIMLATTSGIMTVSENGLFNPEANVSGKEITDIIAQIKATMRQWLTSPQKG